MGTIAAAVPRARTLNWGTARTILIALGAGAVVFGLIAVPAMLATRVAPPSSAVAFPAQIASYSWYTATGQLGVPAAIVYQNGVGVEFMDSPQAVALGSDGSTYRRVGAAEGRTSAADQGDPAGMVLSADGTFVVVGGRNGQGTVAVQSLVTGATREVAIGAGRSAVPLSIAADGDHVLVMLGEGELSKYAVPAPWGTLAMLELSSGDLREYPVRVSSAALSPDGSRLIAQSAQGAVVMDAAGGHVRDVPALNGRVFGDDAWSPDGSRVATIVRAITPAVGEGSTELIGVETLQVSDIATGATSRFPLDSDEHSAFLGWRDDDTVVLQATAGDNSAAFRWMDVDSGTAETFSTYQPGFTGASIASADVARDLVGGWTVESRPSDQGWTVGRNVAAIAGIAVAAVVGLRIRAAADRRRRRRMLLHLP